MFAVGYACLLPKIHCEFPVSESKQEQSTHGTFNVGGEVHIYNSTLMEHVVCELHPCNSPRIVCVPRKQTIVW